MNSIFFNPSLETSTSMGFATDDYLIGPKITVCNPRMFDKAKVEALNISSELLSYIFMAYDYGNDLSYAPNFLDLYENLEIEYAEKTENISNIGKHLAINCEDFIESCQDFDPDPWISYFGTCFTTKDHWNVSASGGLQSKAIHLNTSLHYTAGNFHEK